MDNRLEALDDVSRSEVGFLLTSLASNGFLKTSMCSSFNVWKEAGR